MNEGTKGELNSRDSIPSHGTCIFLCFTSSITAMWKIQLLTKCLIRLLPMGKGGRNVKLYHGLPPSTLHIISKIFYYNHFYLFQMILELPFYYLHLIFFMINFYVYNYLHILKFHLVS